MLKSCHFCPQLPLHCLYPHQDFFEDESMHLLQDSAKRWDEFCARGTEYRGLWWQWLQREPEMKISGPGTMEYPELEGTHQDHQLRQIPLVFQGVKVQVGWFWGWSWLGFLLIFFFFCSIWDYKDSSCPFATTFEFSGLNKRLKSNCSLCLSGETNRKIPCPSKLMDFICFLGTQ